MKRILLMQSILICLLTPFLLGQPVEIDVMNLYEQNNKGSMARNFTSWRDWIYFSADDGLRGRELWAIGPNGPALQADLDSGGGDSFPQSFAIVENRLYFSAKRDRQLHLFRIDEPGGTPVDLGLNDNLPKESSYFQGAFYYFKDTELWRTHSETGLDEIVAIVGSRKPRHSGSHSRPQVLGNLLYFVVVTPTQDKVTLWASDGTHSGTREIAVLYEKSNLALTLKFVEMAELNGAPIVAVSVGNRGVADNNIWNLWQVEGESLIKLHSGEAKLRHRWFRHFQQVGDVGYFVSGDEGNERVFRTDGTAAGTGMVSAAEELLLPDKLTSHHGFLFFTSQLPHPAIYRLDTNGHVVELARFGDLKFENRVDTQLVVGPDQRIYLFADMLGSSGTSLVRLEADGSNITSIYAGRSSEWLVHEDGIFLTVPFEQQGSEIIKIDDSGVTLVADINQRLVPPPFGYSGNWLTSFRDQIYYLNQNDEGIHLFRLEGETKLLLKTLTMDPLRNLTPPRFFTHGNLLYLIFTDKDRQDHLWVTDGIVENTREIQGFAGETGSTLELLGSNEIGLFLLAETDDNRQLCFLGQDGLPKKLLDLPEKIHIPNVFFPEIQPDSAVYPFLTILDGALVLWTTDGTPANTKLISTLFDDVGSKTPHIRVYSGAGQWIITGPFGDAYFIDDLIHYNYPLLRFDESAENGVHLIGDFRRIGRPGITRHKLTFPVHGLGPTSQSEWMEIDRTGETIIPVEDQVAPRQIIGASEESGLVYYLDLTDRLLAWDGAIGHLISEEDIGRFIREIVSLCGADYLLHNQLLDNKSRLVIDRVADPSDGLERISSDIDWKLTSRELFHANDGFYFPGGDIEGGRELWRLDDRGLREVTQLRTGQASTHPFSLTATDQDLYFLALDDSLQLKLWRESMACPKLKIQVRQLFGPLYIAYVEGASDSSFLWRAENATIYGSRTNSQMFFYNNGGARLTVTQGESTSCIRRGELTLTLKNQGFPQTHQSMRGKNLEIGKR